MFNNLLFTWLIVILLLVSTNILIRIYKFYRYNYMFSISIERFINMNGVNLISYFKFTNIFASSFVKWRSCKSFIKMIKTVLYIIYSDNDFINQYSNKMLCVTVFEVNSVNKVHVAISDPVFINYNDQISANELFNLIKWNSYASNRHHNITIVIKIV
jgi:hypothetical protein